MTTRIFSRSTVCETFAIDPKYYHDSIQFPEIKDGKRKHVTTPVHPADQVRMCPELVGKTIVTLSEYIILWFLQEIREGHMESGEVELYCDGQRIRIDETGELIDRWPGGFFRERAALLFGSGE